MAAQKATQSFSPDWGTKLQGGGEYCRREASATGSKPEASMLAHVSMLKCDSKLSGFSV